MDSIEPATAPAPATGTGTSTGTTALTVSAVTGIIHIPSTVTGTGVPAGLKVTAGPQTGGAGTYTTSANSTLTAVALTFTPTSAAVFFPDFVPIIPPPPIGAAQTVPTFPPPTPPPIGAVPVGPLVGPAVAAAGVPPSVAGITQPVVRSTTATGNSTGTTSLTISNVAGGSIYVGSVITGTGVPANTHIVSQTSGTTGGNGVYVTNNATTLTNVALTVTTTFPAFSAPPFYYPGVTPVGPANINTTIWTVPTLAPIPWGPTSVWTAVPPPMTTGTQPIILSATWGLPGPSGSGPGPPTYPNPPGAGRPSSVSAVRNGHEELSERSAGTILPGDNPSHLHQPQPSKDSRGKRMSARNPSGSANRF
jgi:hypothetical protein